MLIRKQSRREKDKVVNLRIKDGKFVMTGTSRVESFGTVIGSVQGLVCKTHHDSNGEEFRLWHLRMKDGEETYDISFPYYCQPIRTVICSLMCPEALSHLHDIKIKAYKGRGNCTKISVYVDDVRVHYAEDMVPANLCQFSSFLNMMIKKGRQWECHGAGFSGKAHDPFMEFLGNCDGEMNKEREYEESEFTRRAL